MKLKTGSWAVLVSALLGLAAPQPVMAREEKPISMEAIMEELANLRSLVEAQQRQIVFIQNARRANDPSQSFFVPVQRGANTTYRYLGQLAFIF